MLVSSAVLGEHICRIVSTIDEKNIDYFIGNNFANVVVVDIDVLGAMFSHRIGIGRNLYPSSLKRVQIQTTWRLQLLRAMYSASVEDNATVFLIKSPVRSGYIAFFGSNRTRTGHLISGLLQKPDQTAENRSHWNLLNSPEQTATAKAKALASSSRNSTQSRPPKFPPTAKAKTRGKRKAPDSNNESASGDDNKTDQPTSRKKPVAPKRARRRSPTPVEEYEDKESDIEEIVDNDADDGEGDGEGDGSKCTNDVGDNDIDGSDENDDELGPEYEAALPPELKTKKRKADDLLTVFSERCTVKFRNASTGVIETLTGCWCNVCKDDAEFVGKQG
ncbi:hypothetical protein BJ138DRAFT_1108115 [Hygrophoropsis aurantiaca]|uniref:Uncharacterized protein n=1 Tax=Hygrophoropsis aurantiaca TaxID=72124 RepID=A0ACB7ZP03_9AGAM|nr:hypothetical protein BJ138DRAFT_1108115 [Hygrophoropsis aurantiaca]